MATATPATLVTANGFTANWTAPKIGSPSNYFLDISSSSNFDAPIAGSPFTLSNSTFSQAVSNLLPGIYYYRVRSGKTLTDTLEPPTSNTVSVSLNYAKPGNALHFDGNNDYLVVPGALYNPQTFTLETWFKTSAGKGGIIGFSNSSGFGSTQHDKMMYLNNDGRLFFGVYNGQIFTINSGIAV
ncbi:hypothetical protein, partial [Umezakia ovalisporum]|uniref:hypothetical protein n=1 Tax=Umezakia ovalisporum TaxID=75695 RepID=UPI0039C5F42A